MQRHYLKFIFINEEVQTNNYWLPTLNIMNSANFETKCMR